MGEQFETAEFGRPSLYFAKTESSLPMPIRSITSQELGALLTEQPDLPLVDVRTPAEYRLVHVAGAKNLPLYQLSQEQLEATMGDGRNGTVYFICKAGVRSYNACRKAHAFGVPDIVNVEGGTSACVRAGLPVERGSRSVLLNHRLRRMAGALIVAGVVLAAVAHPLWIGLSALGGAGLFYTGLTGT